ncbi:MAG: alkaline phosphatase family protein [Candidatus Hadarchaeum sp.]|uniref:alkaline phosphatase family protein n=1 Tax=Candidatus Hadarchaeum sp. TaxID=2883567 RepID=UPI003174EEE5
MLKQAKLIFIGLDAATVPFVETFMAEGALPNLRQMAERGVTMEAIPSTPVDTPTNWATIATGANVNIHGVVSFTTHVVGENFVSGEMRRARTKSSSFCRAEFIWDVAARHGLKPLIINYPVAWPPTLNQGVVIGGMCPGADAWRIARASVHAAGRVTTIPLRLGVMQPRLGMSMLKIFPVECREEVESCLPPLQTKVKLAEQKELDVLLISEGGSEYDGAVFKTLDDTNVTFRLHPGEWSKWIFLPFAGRTGAFRVKLVRLSADGSEIEIYVTDIFETDGWAYPREVAAKIAYNLGPYIEGLECPYISPDVKDQPYGPVNVSMQLLSELARMQAVWFASVAESLLRDPGWDALFMHYHLIDCLGHALLAYLDPNFPEYTTSTAKMVWDIYKQMYKIIDEMVGTIVANCASDNTVIAIVSDHGMLPCWKHINVVKALAEAGLLCYKLDGEVYTVDLSRSKVIPYIDPQHVWINLKGREQDGIVPAAEYESVRTHVIEVLRRIRDPDTGEQVMALVCRREDLGLIGPAEDRIGDVVFFLKPPYTTWNGTLSSLRFARVPAERLYGNIVTSSGPVLGHHTPFLPAERYGLFSNRAMFILVGPKVRKGGRRPIPIGLKDVAPTIAYLLGIPAPANSEGRVIFDILVAPSQVGK